MWVFCIVLKQDVHTLLFCIGCEPFIHPRMSSFVGGEYTVVPVVRCFVHKEPREALKFITAAQNHGTHRVFHTAVTTLDNGELRVRIATKMGRHKVKIAL